MIVDLFNDRAPCFHTVLFIYGLTNGYLSHDLKENCGGYRRYLYKNSLEYPLALGEESEP